MGTAHEETGHGHAQRATAQPSVAFGQVAGGGSKVGAAAYAAQASFDPRDWMAPPPRNPWKRRIGAGVVTGLLGVLGWVGFKQLPSNTVSAATETTDDSAANRASAAASDFENLSEADDEQADEVPFTPRQPLAAGNPFARTAALPVASEVQTPPARATTIQPAATQDEQDENPFAHPATARQTAAVSRFSADSEATATTVKAEFKSTARASTLVQPVAAASSTVAADFGGDQTEPETDDFATDPFAASSPAAAPYGAANRVQLVEAQEEPAAPAQDDEFAFDLSEEQPAPKAVAPARAPRAPAGVAFQFDEAPAQTEPEEELEALPAQLPTANEFGSEFQFDEPAAEQPSGGRPALEASPAVKFPDVEEPTAAPRNFSAPFEPQEITPAAAVTNNPRDEKVHVVQPGENYWSIARQHYSAGRYFSALAEYNKPRIADAKRLKPGMKVLIPSAATLEQRFAKVIQPGGPGAGKPKQKAGLYFDQQQQPLYCVGASDTLGTISQRHLGRFARWSEIYDLNRDQLKTPDALKLGMILKMPTDASELAPAAAIPVSR